MFYRNYIQCLLTLSFRSVVYTVQYGFSALHRLAAVSVSGSHQLAELLLEHGAKRSLRTDTGLIPAQLSTGSSGKGAGKLTLFLVSFKTSSELAIAAERQSRDASIREAREAAVAADAAAATANSFGVGVGVGLSLPSVAIVPSSAVLRPGDRIIINQGLLEGVEGIFRSFKRGRQAMVRLPVYGTDVLVPVAQIARHDT